MIKVYSKDNCMRCTMVKKILKTKRKDFESIDDISKVLQKVEETGILEMPIVEFEEGQYSGSDAVRYVKTLI